MTIRPAIDKDVETIAEMVMQMWLEHADRAPVVLSREYIEKVDAEEWIRGCMAKREDHWYVAEDNNEIVGCISAEVQKKQGMYTSNPMIYIDDLMVKDEARGKGVAQKLIQACLGLAKEQGIGAVDAKIYDFNETAQAVFKKLGFTSEHRQYYKKID